MAGEDIEDAGGDELGGIYMCRGTGPMWRDTNLHVRTPDSACALKLIRLPSRDCVGQNRHGNSLLEAIAKAAEWSPDELEATVNMWLEQCKVGVYVSSCQYGESTKPFNNSEFIRGQRSGGDGLEDVLQ